MPASYRGTRCSGEGALDALGVGRQHAEAMTDRAGLCAGWAEGGSFMVTIRERGETPTPMGPPAPVLEPADDTLSWHAMDRLPPHSVRRRRRLDLVSPERSGNAPSVFPTEELSYRLDVHFRDSHSDEDGVETVLHEYAVVGELHASQRRLESLSAEARVLPWRECPGAVASAERLVGSPVAGLRKHVRNDFTGVTTCTHLNDTLRGLADVDDLLDQLLVAPT